MGCGLWPIASLGPGKFFLTQRADPLLLRWQPQEQQPNPKRHAPLKPAGKRYQEMESMKAWGLSPLEWDAMPESTRAEMIAHEQELNLRMAYSSEEIKPVDGGGIFSGMRRRLGLGPLS